MRKGVGFGRGGRQAEIDRPAGAVRAVAAGSLVRAIDIAHVKEARCPSLVAVTARDDRLGRRISLDSQGELKPPNWRCLASLMRSSISTSLPCQMTNDWLKRRKTMAERCCKFLQGFSDLRRRCGQRAHCIGDILGGCLERPYL